MKMKKIGIVGHVGSGFNEPVKLKDCDKPKDVIVIDDLKTITINGIEYEEIPKEPRIKSAKSATMMAAMMAMFSYDNPFSNQSSRKKPLPTNDIVKEFELIQAKQSNLSRSERDRVEWEFKRCYRVKAK